MVQKLIFAAK
nr:unnamed protein product [Callosobruchus chinensis]